jgi:hypothetical protein
LTARQAAPQALSMRLLRMLFRYGRAAAALLLLAAFAMGAAADARHHLLDHGCDADPGGRSDHCVCAGLHAAPFASEAIAHVAPIAFERELAPASRVLAPLARAAHVAAPRAPPRG